LRAASRRSCRQPSSPGAFRAESVGDNNSKTMVLCMKEAMRISNRRMLGLGEPGTRSKQVGSLTTESNQVPARWGGGRAGTSFFLAVEAVYVLPNGSRLLPSLGFGVPKGSSELPSGCQRLLRSVQVSGRTRSRRLACALRAPLWRFAGMSLASSGARRQVPRRRTRAALRMAGEEVMQVFPFGVCPGSCHHGSRERPYP
jgi:hypothetical protein